MKFILFCLLLIASRAPAIVDEDGSGMSRIWQEQWNHGEKYSPSLDPLADDDGDSMSNYLESLAGTDPKSGLPPLGVTQVTITYTKAVYQNSASGEPTLLTPETASITWLGFVGKSYQLEVSTDLSTGSWSNVGEPITGDGTIIGQAVTLTQPDGSIPPKLFFRVRIGDLDEDFDGLSNAEEYLLGTNPRSQWSDSDFLNDYDEVTLYHTSPTNPMTNGVDLDHIAAGIIDENGNDLGVYAPEIHWLNDYRALGYEYEKNSDGEVLKNRLTIKTSWDPEPFQSTPAGRLPYSGMRPALQAHAFPQNPVLSNIWENPIGVAAGFNGDERNVTGGFVESQVRLFAKGTPPASGRSQTLIGYDYDSMAGGLDTSTPVAYTFTIPEGGSMSPPRVFGDHVPLGDTTNNQIILFAPSFQPVDGLDPADGCDDTENELYRSVVVGKSIEAVLLLDALPEEACKALEIAVEGESGVIQLTNHRVTSERRVVFRITGLKDTLTNGVAVILRSKANHSSIFARMRVRVFNPVTVPVTIYRVWDSRKTDANGNNFTKVDDGASDAEIIAELNKAYQKQVGITFRSEGSKEVDLKNPFGLENDTPGPEDIFDENDQLNNIDTIFKLYELTKNIHKIEEDRRLTIHILKNYKYKNHIGTTWFLRKFTVINSYAKAGNYAHEIGHSLNLASKAKGADDVHDMGPWPKEYLKNKTTGMMYHENRDNSTFWIRQKDWERATSIAKGLK